MYYMLKVSEIEFVFIYCIISILLGLVSSFYYSFTQIADWNPKIDFERTSRWLECKFGMLTTIVI